MDLIDEACEPIASSSSSSSSYFNGVVENPPCSSTTHESKLSVHESYKSIQPSIFHSKHAGQTSNTSNRRRCGVGDKSDDYSKNTRNLFGQMTLAKRTFTRKTMKSVETTRNECLNNHNFNHGWFSPILLLLLLLFWSSPTTLAAPNEITSVNTTHAKDIAAIERLKDSIIPSITSENHGSTNLTSSQPHPSTTSTIPTAAEVANTNSLNSVVNSSVKLVNDTSAGSKASSDEIEMKREITNAILSSAPSNSENDDSNFNDDCSDQHYKEFRCSVTSASCQLGTDEWLRANLESDTAQTHSSPSSTAGYDRAPAAAGLWRLYDTPGEAHDIRIEPFAKARGSRRRLRDGKRQSAVATAAERRGRNHHQLTVDISWQTPPNNSTRQLSAFLLEIVEVREEGGGVGSGDSSTVGDSQLCFLLDVSESNWTEDAILSSPRLHFSSSGIFKFSSAYSITLWSLPRVPLPRLPRRPLAEVTQRFVTPQNPHNGLNRQSPSVVDGISTSDASAAEAVGNGGRREGGEATTDGDYTNGTALSANCTKFSHPYASKWTAGFRRIYLHTLARTIQVEFVGAPPQYCFEQYEVRLLDETATEMLHFGIVPMSAMRTEWIDNTVIYFGEYNFTGLDMDRSYIPSVIPVEKALDGRCLCPVYGIDPYDNKVVCSCIAADWKPVRLTRLDVVKEDLGNATAAPSFVMEQKSTFSDYWLLFSVLNFILFLVVVCIALIAFVIYYQHRSGKIAHIRFVKNTESANGTATGGTAMMANGCGASAVDAQQHSGASSTSRTPLIVDAMDMDGRRQNATVAAASAAVDAPQLAPLNVLLVYAHDSPEHDAAVLALAELLRDAFKMNIGLDVWDAASIECNLADYLSASVINADKVVVVNSIGAYHRFHCKVTERRFVIERNTHVPFDGLFAPQMDMVMQHHCIISVRFVGTPNMEVLPLLTDRLQYVLPDNLVPFLSALLGRNVKGHPRLSDPSAMRVGEAARRVGAMRTAAATDDWFVWTHHRRAVAALERPSTVVVGRLPTTTVVQSTPADCGVVVTIDDAEEEAELEKDDNNNLTALASTLPLVAEDSSVVVSSTTTGSHIGSAVPELVFSATTTTPNTSVTSSPAAVRRAINDDDAIDDGDHEKVEQAAVAPDPSESSQSGSPQSDGVSLKCERKPVGTLVVFPPESVTSAENAEFDAIGGGRSDAMVASSSSNGTIASSSVAEDDDNDGASGEDSSLDSNNNNVAADSGVFTESFDQHSAVVRSPYAVVDRRRSSLHIGRLEEKECTAVEPTDRQQCNGYTKLNAVLPMQHNTQLLPANPRGNRKTPDDQHRQHAQENGNVEMVDFRPTVVSATDHRPNNRRNRRNVNSSKKANGGIQIALESSRPLRSDNEDANDSATMISNGGDDATMMMMVNDDVEASKCRPPTTSRRKGKRHQQQRQYYPIPS